MGRKEHETQGRGKQLEDCHTRREANGVPVVARAERRE
jgi:hypothetical protein